MYGRTPQAREIIPRIHVRQYAVVRRLDFDDPVAGPQKIAGSSVAADFEQSRK